MCQEDAKQVRAVRDGLAHSLTQIVILKINIQSIAIAMVVGDLNHCSIIESKC